MRGVLQEGAGVGHITTTRTDTGTPAMVSPFTSQTRKTANHRVHREHRERRSVGSQTRVVARTVPSLRHSSATTDSVQPHRRTVAVQLSSDSRERRGRVTPSRVPGASSPCQKAWHRRGLREAPRSIRAGIGRGALYQLRRSRASSRTPTTTTTAEGVTRTPCALLSRSGSTATTWRESRQSCAVTPASRSPGIDSPHAVSKNQQDAVLCVLCALCGCAVAAQPWDAM